MLAWLLDAYLDFQIKNHQQKKVFIVQWVGPRNSFLSTKADVFLANKYRHFGSCLYVVLFDCWAFSLMEGEPLATLSQVYLVSKHERPVVCYVVD